MRLLCSLTLIAGLLAMTATLTAQPPPRPDESRGERGSAGDASSFVDRLMTFDKNQDGKLAKTELTDARLHALFERADTNTDEVVTKEELTTLFAKESASLTQGGGRGGPPNDRGRGGPGGPPPGGGRGPGGSPQPGQILSAGQRAALNLTAKQQQQLDELQKDVDAKLAKVLTEDQRRQLREQRDRGPGGRPGGDRPPRDGAN